MVLDESQLPVAADDRHETHSHPRRRHRVLKSLAAATALLLLVAATLCLWPASAIWSGPSYVGGSSTGLQALSCSTPRSCLTFDFNGQTYVLRGAHWHPGPRLFGADYEVPNGVSCASPQFCAVTGDSGHVAVISNGHVAYSMLDPAAGPNAAVSCPTARFCMAVGGSRVFVWNGTRWSPASHVPGPAGGLSSVSCVSAKFCALGGANEGVATFNSGVWRFDPLAQLSTSYDTIGQLSCATPSYCVAITLFSGQWLTFDGTSWKVHPSFEGPQNEGTTPTMLTCPSEGHCIAASTSDVLYRLEGGRWHQLGYLFRQSVLSRLIESLAPGPAVSVSCPAESACVAVDGGGSAYVGHPFSDQ